MFLKSRLPRFDRRMLLALNETDLYPQARRKSSRVLQPKISLQRLWPVTTGGRMRLFLGTHLLRSSSASYFMMIRLDLMDAPSTWLARNIHCLESRIYSTQPLSLSLRWDPGVDVTPRMHACIYQFQYKADASWHAPSLY